ncbi:MAG TPA: hypothetical protein VK281_09965, partial [Xanthobacteraceae bacterium]|nr:hypothetical protein [Xanthobacteraceae bacterium]
MVVPSEGPIEIEATVSNRDIGFVHEGQDAQIKVDTFNFTRYGLLLSVSRDSISREKPHGRPNDRAPGSDKGSSEPPGEELPYGRLLLIFPAGCRGHI